MIDKFSSLGPEKQLRIINAAMAEFALKGYEQASTNEMVKDAGISKGLLFHYFKNKKQLYLYVYNHCIQVSMDELYSKIDYEEKDFFRMMRSIVGIKLELLSKYPELFTFIQEAYLETTHEIKDDLNALNQKILQMGMAKLFANIDTSGFVEGLDLPRALNIIQWTVEGMANEELRRCKILHREVDYDKLFKQGESYLDLCEKLFIREVNQK